MLASSLATNFYNQRQQRRASPSLSPVRGGGTSSGTSTSSQRSSPSPDLSSGSGGGRSGSRSSNHTSRMVSPSSLSSNHASRVSHNFATSQPSRQPPSSAFAPTYIRPNSTRAPMRSFTGSLSAATSRRVMRSAHQGRMTGAPSTGFGVNKDDKSDIIRLHSQRLNGTWGGRSSDAFTARHRWSFDSDCDDDDLMEVGYDDDDDDEGDFSGPTVEVLDSDASAAASNNKVSLRPFSSKTATSRTASGLRKSAVSRRWRPRKSKNQTVLDLNAACDWNITGMDVTIPMAREEDGAARHEALTNESRVTISADTTNRETGRNKASDAMVPASRDGRSSSSMSSSLSSSSLSSSSSSSSTFTAYVIRIVAGRKVWHVSHRYSDFVQLHQALRETLGKSSLPRLPGKHILRFNNRDPAFVEKRRKDLEVYLRAVVRLESAWSHPFLVQFLDNNSETLGLQNKYERMMRVQGVLIRASQMNSRRNAATERALKKSMQEVSSLKARLERLEQSSKEVEDRAAELAKQKEEEQLRREEAMMQRIQQQVVQQMLLQQQPQQQQQQQQRKQYQQLQLQQSYPSSFEVLSQFQRLRGNLLSTVSHFAIDSIMPSKEAETKRQNVVDFITRVVGTALGAEVFQTGSFPTKTYLPGSDLDMTVCTGSALGDEWFRKLHDALLVCGKTDASRAAATSSSSPPSSLAVRNTMWINADVKLIKCVVDNISVDITARQFQALSSAHMVEVISRTIGCGHLFKRSLLLVKSWLSLDAMKLARMEASGIVIYGSDQGGLSTYTLVVMLAMLFNTHPILSSLWGKGLATTKNSTGSDINAHPSGGEWLTPLHVLSLFLDVFSEWQWGLHCVSVHGAVHAYTHKLVNSDVVVATDHPLLPLHGRAQDSVSSSCLLPLNLQTFDDRFFSPFRALETAFDMSSNASVGEGDAVTTSLTKVKRKKRTTNTGKGGVKQGDAGGSLDGNSEDNLNATDEIDITRETEYFDSNIFHRSSCMVIDPVDRGNNVARAFSRKNVQHLSSILSHGKICLVDALQCVSPSIEAVSTANDDDARAVFVQCAESILRAMFPASHTKFRAGRPDLLIHPRQRLGQVRGDGRLRQSLFEYDFSNVRYGALSGNAEKLRGTFEYAKLIVGANWTEETLRSVLLQVLHAKPADVILPVGEIGKILQVRTGNPLISTEIKERYGGLKKFLVDCEGIIVHDDHPFNPSVTVDEGIYQQLASSGALNGIDVGVVQITGAPGGNARRSKKTRGRKKRNRASKKSQGEANVQPVVLDGGKSGQMDPPRQGPPQPIEPTMAATIIAPEASQRELVGGGKEEPEELEEESMNVAIPAEVPTAAAVSIVTAGTAAMEASSPSPKRWLRSSKRWADAADSSSDESTNNSINVFGADDFPALQ